MSLNLLAINVGNSRCQFATFTDGELGEIYSVNHEAAADRRKLLAQAFEPLASHEDVPVLIASVNQRAAAAVRADVQGVLKLSTMEIESDLNVPIGRQVDEQTLVGVDRLLNAAAAYDRLKQAAVVIDAGTAMTVDFVDGAGTFHGGAILPGAQMMLNAMHAQTAALPQVEFAPPAQAIGPNTAAAMLSGVYHGLRGAVRELCEKYAEVYGAYPHILATGGNAQALFADYELIEAIVPELTLMGMMITLRYQTENTDE